MEEEREKEDQAEQENNGQQNNLLSTALGLATKIWTTKTKIIIVLVIAGFLFAALILLLLFGTMFMIFDKESTTINGNLSFSSVGDNSGFWWPVGSNETTTENGITFASGPPAITSISSNFQPNRCLGGTCRPHYGFDIGTNGVIGVYNLIATKSGTVIKVFNGCADNGSLNNNCGGQLGNYVTIDHGNGFYSRYQHMAQNSITVKEGDTVQQGQVIGKIGKSGRCTGAHLHFQIHVGGTSNSFAVDPLTYVDPNNPRPSSTPSGPIEGNNVMQSVCLTLKAAGYPDTGVAAALGNLKRESEFDLNVINELGCRGIVQWCDTRKDELLSKYGSNWNKLENQLEMMTTELNSAYFSSTRKSMLSNDSLDSKTYVFCMKYEIPGTAECQSGIRQRYARDLLSYVQNGCK